MSSDGSSVADREPASSATVSDDLRSQFAALLRGEPDLIADPYSLYDRIRSAEPVLRYQEGTFVLTRYADIKAVFRNTKGFPSPSERLTKYDDRFSLLSEEERAMYREMAEFERNFVSRKMGEAHRRHRSAMSRGFVPRRIAGMRETVEQIVADELDDLAAAAAASPGKPVDLMRFAYRVPLMVIMDLLGAPREDGERVKHWGDAVLEAILFVPLQPERVRLGHKRLGEYREYARELVERNRGTAKENGNLVTILLDAEEDDKISVEELTATFLHLLIAGHETTTNLLGNGIHAMLADRGQWEQVVQDPEGTVSGAVEEALRFDSPVQQSPRVAAEDTEIAGVAIKAGDAVILTEGAGNRDPAVFAEPGRFDLQRELIDHLSLGHGQHFCLGSALARQEGQATFRRLAERFPDIRLAGNAGVEDWVPRPRLRGLKRLPVYLGPDRGSAGPLPNH